MFSWLVYSDPGYNGLSGVLLVGEYPHPQSWGFPEPFIGSLRPLRMVKQTTYFLYYNKVLTVFGLTRCVSISGSNKGGASD